MSIPAQFPPRLPRAMSVQGALSEGTAEAGPAEAADAAPAPGSWPWRRAALLACIAAQLITIADLERRSD